MYSMQRFMAAQAANGLEGIRAENPENKSTWQLQFTPHATDAQKAALQAALAAVQIKDDIYLQILELEAQITPRRLREAILNADGGWLQTINTQIAALRASLTT